MKVPELVIITNRNDYAVNEVTKLLKERDFPFLRIHPDEPQRIKFSATKSNSMPTSFCIEQEGMLFTLNNRPIIWYRQPTWPREQNDKNQVKSFIDSEWRTSFNSMFSLLSGYWVNHPLLAKNIYGHNKLIQLNIASLVDFSVPDTIISNSFHHIIDFCKKHGGEIACKPLYGQRLTSGDEKSFIGVYTQLISQSQLEKMRRNVELAPAIYQRYIRKKSELRITVIGSNIFSCEIHSQNSEKTKHDWRRYDFANVAHNTFTLPCDIIHKLKAFMVRSGLNYGAFDFILTPENQYVFIEVNPSGQYGWIEQLTSMPISQSIADSFLMPEKNGLRMFNPNEWIFELQNAHSNQ